jgi:hypothetical protein
MSPLHQSNERSDLQNGGEGHQHNNADGASSVAEATGSRIDYFRNGDLPIMLRRKRKRSNVGHQHRIIQRHGSRSLMGGEGATWSPHTKRQRTTVENGSSIEVVESEKVNLCLPNAVIETQKHLERVRLEDPPRNLERKSNNNPNSRLSVSPLPNVGSFLEDMEQRAKSLIRQRQSSVEDHVSSSSNNGQNQHSSRDSALQHADIQSRMQGGEEGRRVSSKNIPILAIASRSNQATPSQIYQEAIQTPINTSYTAQTIFSPEDDVISPASEPRRSPSTTELIRKRRFGHDLRAGVFPYVAYVVLPVVFIIAWSGMNYAARHKTLRLEQDQLLSEIMSRWQILSKDHGSLQQSYEVTQVQLVNMRDQYDTLHQHMVSELNPNFQTCQQESKTLANELRSLSQEQAASQSTLQSLETTTQGQSQSLVQLNAELGMQYRACMDAMDAIALASAQKGIYDRKQLEESHRRDLAAQADISANALNAIAYEGERKRQRDVQTVNDQMTESAWQALEAINAVALSRAQAREKTRTTRKT